LPEFAGGCLSDNSVKKSGSLVSTFGERGLIGVESVLLDKKDKEDKDKEDKDKEDKEELGFTCPESSDRFGSFPLHRASGPPSAGPALRLSHQLGGTDARLRRDGGETEERLRTP
jgi:hypothetical protein